MCARVYTMRFHPPALPSPLPGPNQYTILKQRRRISALWSRYTPLVCIMNGPHKAVGRPKDSVAKHSHNKGKNEARIVVSSSFMTSFRLPY